MDTSADLYSLGAVLYEMPTAKVPFDMALVQPESGAELEGGGVRVLFLPTPWIAQGYLGLWSSSAMARRW